MDLCTKNCSYQSVGPVNQVFGLLVQTLLASQCSISPDYKWPPDFGPAAEKYGLDEYDFIIIGAGSAGCNSFYSFCFHINHIDLIKSF